MEMAVDEARNQEVIVPLRRMPKSELVWNAFADRTNSAISDNDIGEGGLVCVAVMTIDARAADNEILILDRNDFPRDMPGPVIPGPGIR